MRDEELEEQIERRVVATHVSQATTGRRDKDHAALIYLMVRTVYDKLVDLGADEDSVEMTGLGRLVDGLNNHAVNPAQNPWPR